MNKIVFILFVMAVCPALVCGQSTHAPLPDIDVPAEEVSAPEEEPPDVFVKISPSVSIEPEDAQPKGERGELPVLKDIPVSVIPSDVLLDAFGLPVNPPPVMSKDAKKGASGPQQAGWKIGKVVTRLAIQGVWPGREVIIDTVPIPLGGTFVVNVKENEKTFFHVRQITDTHVVFGWAKDDSTYVYPLPAPQPSDADMDSAKNSP
ncbi:MAG: hypothetical protein V1746_00430 [bacterium]